MELEDITCNLFHHQSCYLPESLIYLRKYMEKALSWQRDTHVPHGSFFLCWANMFPILAPDSSPELETLNLWLMLPEIWDMVLWLPGTMAGVCPDDCVWDQASRLVSIKIERRGERWEKQERLFPLKDWVSWSVRQTDFCWCYWKMPSIFWVDSRCSGNSLIEVLRWYNRAGHTHVICSSDD